MLAARYKAFFNRLANPVARRLAALGVSPTAVTGLGVGLVLASCLFLLLTRRLATFCFLVTASALCDAFDGAVARVSGRVSKTGAYLDALADRVTEVAVMTAVAWVTGYWLLSMLAVAGSLLVSYAKARAAMEVAVTNQEWPDLMERTERDVCYVVGLLASQWVGWRPFGRDLFWWTLAALVCLTSATVIQRAVRATRLIHSRG